MSVVRGIIGATLGAAAAGIALRVRSVSKERQQPIAEVLADLPELISEDVAAIKDAAQVALRDGQRAASAARIEFDEQVAARARRTKGNDV